MHDVRLIRCCLRFVSYGLSGWRKSLNQQVPGSSPGRRTKQNSWSEYFFKPLRVRHPYLGTARSNGEQRRGPFEGVEPSLGLDDAHHRPVTRFQFDDAVQVRHPYVGTARGNAVGRIKPPDDVRKADDAHQ